MTTTWRDQRVFGGLSIIEFIGFEPSESERPGVEETARVP